MNLKNLKPIKGKTTKMTDPVRHPNITNKYEGDTKRIGLLMLKKVLLDVTIEMSKQLKQ